MQRAAGVAIIALPTSSLPARSPTHYLAAIQYAHLRISVLDNARSKSLS